jgi:hypothetical protein
MTETANKRAALALHGLTVEDRNWVLSKLASRDQELLGGFLDELQELGFPSELSDLAHEVDAKKTSLDAVPEVQLVDAAAPKTVYGVLKNEQVPTIALVMAYHPWQWRKRVMRLLGRAKRRSVEQAILNDNCAVMDAVRREVIKSLAKAIVSVSDAAPTASLFRSRRSS